LRQPTRAEIVAAAFAALDERMPREPMVAALGLQSVTL
jgi:hypothetical protein